MICTKPLTFPLEEKKRILFPFHFGKIKVLFPFFLTGSVLTLYFLDRSSALPTCLKEITGETEVEVKEVVDGDTFKDLCGRRFRLIGVDSWEINEPPGLLAKEFVEKFLNGKKVIVEVCKEEPQDRYGRFLVFVKANGKDLGELLLSEGLAYPLPIPPCGSKVKDHYRKKFEEGWKKKSPSPFFSLPKAFSAEKIGAFCGSYGKIQGEVKEWKKEREQIRFQMGKVKVFIPSRAIHFHPSLNKNLKGYLVEVEGKIRCGKKGARITLWDPDFLKILPR
jgi:endonuclease YncB( thermonuclease family)